MTWKTLAPWSVTGAALALSAWSWLAPPAQVVPNAAPESAVTPAPHEVASHRPLVASVSASAAPSADELEAVVRAAVQAELADHGRTAPSPRPTPDPVAIEEQELTQADASSTCTNLTVCTSSYDI